MDTKRCKNKITFNSKADVLQHLKDIRNPANKTSNQKNMRPYECPKCGKWHMTSMSKRLFKIVQKQKERKVNPR